MRFFKIIIVGCMIIAMLFGVMTELSDFTVHAIDSSERAIAIYDVDYVEYTLCIPMECTEYDTDIAFFVVTGFSRDLRGKVEIRNKIDTLNDGGNIPVTVIGAKAFCNNDSIDKVIIPDSVVSIRDRAFAGCDKLVDVTIGSEEYINGSTNKTTIGESAFYGCDKLTNVKLGENVTKIKKDAFRNTNLERITIPDGISTLGNKVIIGSNAFDKSTVIVDKTGKEFTLLLTSDRSSFESSMYILWFFAMGCGLLVIIVPLLNYNKIYYIRDYDQKKFKRRNKCMITFDKKEQYEKIEIWRENPNVIEGRGDMFFYKPGSDECRIALKYFYAPVKFRSDEYWNKHDAVEMEIFERDMKKRAFDHLLDDDDEPRVIVDHDKSRSSRRNPVETFISDTAALHGDDMYYDPGTGTYSSVDSDGTFKDEYGVTRKIKEKGDGWIKDEYGCTHYSSMGRFKNGHYTDVRDDEYWEDND